jgi:hypothetical protein
MDSKVIGSACWKRNGGTGFGDWVWLRASIAKEGFESSSLGPATSVNMKAAMSAEFVCPLHFPFLDDKQSYIGALFLRFLGQTSMKATP